MSLYMSTCVVVHACVCVFMCIHIYMHLGRRFLSSSPSYLLRLGLSWSLELTELARVFGLGAPAASRFHFPMLGVQMHTIVWAFYGDAGIQTQVLKSHNKHFAHSAILTVLLYPVIFWDRVSCDLGYLQTL